MENEPNNNQPNIGEAINRIHGLMAEVNVQGANDSEFESFRIVISQLQAGTITPSEAIAQAEAIKGGKMDYH
ncbi:hypothetical protein K2P47_01650 [Patescibacteria group bacterium]|nr:hypothetical protein [Patescibacteria group bacterium]